MSGEGDRIINPVFSLTVALDRDLRPEEAEMVIEAVKMIKGVLAVTPHEVNPEFHGAQARALANVRARLWQALESL